MCLSPLDSFVIFGNHGRRSRNIWSSTPGLLREQQYYLVGTISVLRTRAESVSMLYVSLTLKGTSFSLSVFGHQCTNTRYSLEKKLVVFFCQEVNFHVTTTLFFPQVVDCRGFLPIKGKASFQNPNDRLKFLQFILSITWDTSNVSDIVVSAREIHRGRQ